MSVKTMCSITKTLVPLIFFLLILWAGCSKGPTNSDDNNPPSDVAFDADGIWIGAFTFRENGQVSQNLITYALIAPDGRSFFMVPDTGYDFYYNPAAVGICRYNGSAIEGQLKIFKSAYYNNGSLTITAGKVFQSTADNKTFTNLTAKFSGTADPLMGSGDLVMTLIDSAYSLPSSLSLISGHWSFVDEYNVTTFLDIAADGNFSGGNNVGGQFKGRFSLIDADKNLYDITSFTISNLEQPWDGTYQGLATLEQNELTCVIVKQDDSFGFLMVFSK